MNSLPYFLKKVLEILENRSKSLGVYLNETSFQSSNGVSVLNLFSIGSIYLS